MARPPSFCSAPLAALLLAGLLTACDSRGSPAPQPADPHSQQNPAAVPAPAVPVEPERPAAKTERPGPLNGEIPLTPGVYVTPDSPCAAPANAGFRIYDGRGISGSATRGCRLTVRSQEGDTFRIEQSCEDTYSGRRTTTAQTVRAPNSRSFVLTEQGEAGMSFRLCPAGEAAAYLQDMVPAP